MLSVLACAGCHLSPGDFDDSQSTATQPDDGETTSDQQSILLLSHTFVVPDYDNWLAAGWPKDAAGHPIGSLEPPTGVAHGTPALLHQDPPAVVIADGVVFDRPVEFDTAVPHKLRIMVCTWLMMVCKREAKFQSCKDAWHKAVKVRLIRQIRLPNKAKDSAVGVPQLHERAHPCLQGERSYKTGLGNSTEMRLTCQIKSEDKDKSKMFSNDGKRKAEVHGVKDVWNKSVKASLICQIKLLNEAKGIAVKNKDKEVGSKPAPVVLFNGFGIDSFDSFHKFNRAGVKQKTKVKARSKPEVFLICQMRCKEVDKDRDREGTKVGSVGQGVLVDAGEAEHDKIKGHESRVCTYGLPCPQGWGYRKYL